MEHQGPALGPVGPLPLTNGIVHEAAFTSPGHKWKWPYKMQLETSPVPPCHQQ